MAIGQKLTKNDFSKMSKGVISVNNSRSSDYNKQRDNQRYPLETCGPTSMAMALSQSGYVVPTEKGQDPADAITMYLTTKPFYERMYDMLGTRDTRWKPFNLHALLTAGVNEMMGKTVSQFRTNWKLKNLLFNIVQGGGAVLSGDFTLPDGRELGHMVSLAGFETYQQNIEMVEDYTEVELKALSSFIIDDPYGNWYTGYKDHHGNDIEYSIKDFNSIFRVKDSPNSKWAHLILPNNEVL